MLFLLEYLFFVLGAFVVFFFVVVVVVVCFSFQEDYYLNLNPYNKDYYYYSF